MIERGTLRTFGGHSAVIASFFAGFASTLMYIAWWYMGMLLARIIWVPNKLKSAMGFKKDRRQSAQVAAV
jgi:methane/ammonia monooxygenase subunit A